MGASDHGLSEALYLNDHWSAWLAKLTKSVVKQSHRQEGPAAEQKIGT
jgi:hypothetical protein